MPPDQAVVPPTCSVFSSRHTFRPSVAATTAAAIPPAPAPNTTTSNSFEAVTISDVLPNQDSQGLPKPYSFPETRSKKLKPLQTQDHSPPLLQRPLPKPLGTPR